jgi:hypothetical protein
MGVRAEVAERSRSYRWWKTAKEKTCWAWRLATEWRRERAREPSRAVRRVRTPGWRGLASTLTARSGAIAQKVAEAETSVGEGDVAHEAVSIRAGWRMWSSSSSGSVSAKEARKAGWERRVGSGRLMPPKEDGSRAWRWVAVEASAVVRARGEMCRMLERAARRRERSV